MPLRSLESTFDLDIMAQGDVHQLDAASLASAREAVKKLAAAASVEPPPLVPPHGAAAAEAVAAVDAFSRSRASSAASSLADLQGTSTSSSSSSVHSASTPPSSASSSPVQRTKPLSPANATHLEPTYDAAAPPRANRPFPHHSRSSSSLRPSPSRPRSSSRSRVSLGTHLAAWGVRRFLGVPPQPLEKVHEMRPAEASSVRVSREWAASREAGRDVELHVYTPGAADVALDEGRLAPVVINWHGSGFVTPGLGQDHAFCYRIAERLGAVVVDADYRKAPEDPFPAALEDAEDVVAWTLAQTHRFDVSRVALTGFSAGGYIALAASLLAGPEKVTAVAATYPVTDLLMPADARRAPRRTYAAASQSESDDDDDDDGDAADADADVGSPSSPRRSPSTPSQLKAGVVLPTWLVRFFQGCFLNARQYRRNLRSRYGALLRLTDVDPSRFPPTVLVSCGDADTFYDDGRDLVRRLLGAGHASAEFVRHDAMGHAWDLDADRNAEAEALRDEYYSRVAATFASAWRR